MNSELFGTDGIRGRAGEWPLDAPTVRRIGRALARRVGGGDGPPGPRILIGRDTRSSGASIESWLATGIVAGGGRPVSVGVITTPAVASLTLRLGNSAGVVISASHNPFPDNGIKLFSADGTKSDVELERTISEDVADPTLPEVEDEPYEVLFEADLKEEYLRLLTATVPDPSSFRSLRLGLDCANGAGHRVGPRLFRKLGMEVVSIGISPDGENINRDCGSTHLQAIRRLVLEGRCELGAALDGDGDRLLMVDERGREVNGDAILLMCARYLDAHDKLPLHGVVATVMSNLALEKSLASHNITLHRTQVGDKYVAAELKQRGLALGGEQSGHIIFPEYAPTGDGLLTLLQVLNVLGQEKKSLGTLANLEPFPQILLNVPVEEKRDVQQVPEIARAIQEAEHKIHGRGRLLIRYSGTEPLLRIMMEGPDEAEIRSLSNTIADAARRTLGRQMRQA